MFCQTCRGEFREGMIECPRCREALVSELTAPACRAGAERLPTAAILAIFGTGLIFMIRTIGTFFISSDLVVARAVSITILGSYLSISAFFLVFLDEVVRETQPRLRFGTWLALTGCVAAAVIVALNSLILFDLPLVSGRRLSVASSIASMLMPATGVIFFAAYRAESGSTSARLAAAINLALVGAIVSAAAHGVAAAFTGLTPGNFWAGSILPMIAGVPVIAFAVGTWIHFLWVIRQERA